MLSALYQLHNWKCILTLIFTRSWVVSPWPNKRTNTSYTYINFKPSLHCTLYICHNFALPKPSERVYKIFWIAATRAENTQSCGETFLYSWQNGMPNPQSKQCRVMLNNKYHNIIKSKVSVGCSDASLICYFCLISGWTWLNWRLSNSTNTCYCACNLASQSRNMLNVYPNSGHSC